MMMQRNKVLRVGRWVNDDGVLCCMICCVFIGRAAKFARESRCQWERLHRIFQFISTPSGTSEPEADVTKCDDVAKIGDVAQRYKKICSEEAQKQSNLKGLHLAILISQKSVGSNQQAV